MPPIAVEREDDPRIADYRNVPDPDLALKKGIFIAEGRLVVRRLLTESPLTARSVMATASALESIADVLASHPDLPVYSVTQAAMDAVTGFNVHRGCLAIGDRPAPRHCLDLVTHARTLVIIERIGNADNVGGIFRNAVAFGADAILLGPACADPLYRKAIRTSMGAALLLPFAEASPWPGVLHEMRAAGFSLVAMTPSPDADALRAVACRLRGVRAAIVLGHEGDGLTSAALDACDYRARIAMSPSAMSSCDSLNVASASAIALYELMQRD
jgi:tRNA G18 (ribose-2'-O)-methylase SpoU